MSSTAEGVIDLRGFKDRQGSLIPEGRYLVVIDDAEWSRSNSGNPMLTVFLEVVEGEHAGATLVDRLTQTENALFRTVNFLQGIGKKFNKKKPFKLPASAVIGKSAYVDVTDGEPYMGRVKSEVRGYTPAPKKAKAEPEPDIEDVEDEPVEESDGGGMEEFAPTNGKDKKAKAETDDEDETVYEAVDLDEVEDL